MTTEQQIRAHWQAHPVDENVFARLQEEFGGDYDAYFNAYDNWRYAKQGHILDALDRFDWQGKRVLEVGLGQGSDSEQLIRRGARWSGVDLTEELVSRVTKRMEIRGLPYERIERGSVLDLPFDDGSFDCVYSHGVLQVVPDVQRAQREIRRVLKHDGRLVIMLYAKNSLNYHVAIKIVRRVGLALIYYLPIPVSGVYADHKRLAREVGLGTYLKMENFIHRNTDGPFNPYVKVHSKKDILTDFPDFELVQTFKLWMHAPPLPVHWMPGESLLGWHLWAELKRRS